MNKYLVHVAGPGYAYSRILAGESEQEVRAIPVPRGHRLGKVNWIAFGVISFDTLFIMLDAVDADLEE